MVKVDYVIKWVTQVTILQFYTQKLALKEENSCLIQIFFGQVIKGYRWMPWHQQAMKDANQRYLRGAEQKALNRRFPNGETRRE